MIGRRGLRGRRTLWLALALLAIGAWQTWERTRDTRASRDETIRPPIESTAGVERIEQAFLQKQSDVWVESTGIVVRELADDDHGSRHQRFLLEIETGRTLLFAHNIDLAPRVPVDRGDRIDFRGEYEWNDKGGVIHWTHHDPDGRLAGGWIEHDGRRYE